MTENDDEKTKVGPRKSLIDEASVRQTLNAVLTITSGVDTGKEFKIAAGESVIGRGEDVDIYIDDEAASRRHAAIVFRNLEFRIKDLDSSNGTYLNGSEVSEYALRNGDKIMVGDTMFKFSVSRA